MQELNRVSSYLVLLLAGAGYYCIEPKHLDGTAIIAGKDGQGFIVLVHKAVAKSAPPDLPDELSFLNLPVYPVAVRPVSNPKQGRAVLDATMSAELKALLPIGESGEFGILVQTAQPSA